MEYLILIYKAIPFYHGLLPVKAKPWSWGLLFNQVTYNIRRGRIRWDHGSVPCRPLFLWSSLELGLRIEIFRLVFVFVDKTTLFPVRQNQFVLSQRKLQWKVALSTKLRRMIVSPPACLKGTVILQFNWLHMFLWQGCQF